MRQELVDLNFVNTVELYNKQKNCATITDENINNTYQWLKTIPQLFEEQVERTPDRIAVIYEDISLTYRQLDILSNQFAAYLKQHYRIDDKDLIGLCIGRSEQLLIAILGILKVGCAYVPIDPNYPELRLKHILMDIKANVICTETPWSANLKKIIHDTNLASELLLIDLPNFRQIINNLPGTPINSKINASDLAYIIYTSGTTGLPKGVMQTHENISHLFTATHEIFNFTEEDVWTLFHSYVFDFSVWEIWGALLYGGKLIIPTVEEIKDSYLFFQLCEKQHVSILNMTPLVFYQFMDVALKQRKLVALRYVIFGGDTLSLIKLSKWYEFYPNINMVNMYGITETTVHTTYYAIDPKKLSSASVIGNILPGKTAYILDEHLQPVATGEVGELYIGGKGLARGYLNLAELTSSCFIKNPFQSEYEKNININTHLYKTGDLVRQLSDNALVYIGRNDFQVKIRGFRIELGEIENAMLTHQGVSQAIVLCKEQGENKILVAYYVGADITGSTLKSYLEGRLPMYMVPQIFISLDKLPLNINGKIERQLLPEPEMSRSDPYIAPTSDLEQVICKLFANVLGLVQDNIGINDDFFQIGGDSINCLQLINKFFCNLSIKLNVVDIFKYRTPRKLTEYIKKLHVSQNNQTSQMIYLNYCRNVLSDYNSYQFINKKLNIDDDFKDINFNVENELINIFFYNKSIKILFGYTDIIITALGLALKDINGFSVNHINYKVKSIDEFNHLKVIEACPLRLDLSSVHIEQQLIIIKEMLRLAPKMKCEYYNLNNQDLIFPLVDFDINKKIPLTDIESKETNSIDTHHIEKNKNCNNTHDAILKISALVGDDKIKFHIKSSLSMHVINIFIKSFKHHIDYILRYLHNNHNTHYTFSDFNDYESYSIINNNTKDKAPLMFIFPPGDCGYEGYMNTLIPSLHGINVVLFNNFYIYIKNKNIELSEKFTIEKLASLYIAHVKFIQPRGPYYFFGWSYGGVLAMEIARQLILMGDLVADIVMVDSIFSLEQYYKHTGDIKYEANKIFYDYKPCFKKISLDNTNLVLLKSESIPNDYSNPNYKLFKFMAKHTAYNYLDKIINKKYITVIPIRGDHLNWLQEKSSVDTAANILQDITLNSVNVNL